ncbi:MAG: alkaline phosphatase family protein [Calditrichaceae bacterium]|nr:alkaline phosphatase family protein [Calditrichaceae bacterium]MBN2707463.1 alkaline phosphatase family protein [Calditrichaceae bacterium]RQV94030.1 MAG: hypothetical protein EH224_11345 [Calditrichota bacterium]
MTKRIFVLALDGTPYSLLKKLSALNIMPNLTGMIKKGFLKQMDSVYPPVSSVAWASFMTGLPPAGHGILGFVERDPKTMDWYTPLADRLKGRTLWEKLSDKGKRVFVMNVPMTYPPRMINGISVCGFLGNDILKGTYPEEMGYLLKSMGYRIDANTELAKSDLFLFYKDVMDVLHKRIDVMNYFWRRESWDFFMVHIMETDRLQHFFWEFFETKKQPFYDMFIQFYRYIDKIIGDILSGIPDNMGFLALSDHGFTTLKKEVYINHWLEQMGYLRYNKTNPQNLKDMDGSSLAYSLYPGRIYINLRGRERWGRVASEIEYEIIRNEISQKLYTLKDPDSGESIIKKVFKGEEVFENVPTASFENRSFDDLKNRFFPDLLAVAGEGYDLKGNLIPGALFKKKHFNGTHTYDDAFIAGQNISIPSERFSIDRISKIILEYVE